MGGLHLKLGLVLLLGCAEGGTGSFNLIEADASTTDADREDRVFADPPEERDSATAASRPTERSFLMHELSLVTQASGGSTVLGLNLDGMTSTATDVQGCEKADFSSPQPFLHEGVDNQLVATLLGLPASLRTVNVSFRGTDHPILLVRLLGVDDTTSDTSVRVELVSGRVVGEGTLDIGSDGNLASDQSIWPEVILGVLSGWIEDGIVRTDSQDSLISFSVGVQEQEVRVRLAQLSFELDDPSEGAVLGGSVDLNDAELLLSATIDSAETAGSEALLRGILESQADIRAADDGSCSELSFALSYRAIPVQLR